MKPLGCLIAFAALLSLVVYFLNITLAWVIGVAGVIWAALRWGMQGGALFSITATMIVGLATSGFGVQVPPQAILAGIIAYVIIGLVVGRMKDTMEWQRAELKRSSERLELALDGARQGWWDWNIPTGQVHRDARYLALFGKSPKDMEETLAEFQSAIHPEDREKLMDALYRHLEENTPFYEAEYRIMTDTGEWKWLVDRGKIVAKDAEGQPLRVVGVGQDISDTKRMEETLAIEREELAVTLRSIGDGVIVTDLNSRVTMLNWVAEELTGWKEEQAVGQPLETVFNIVNEHTGEPSENPVGKVLATGRVQGLANHTALICRDGAKRSIADSAAPIRSRDGEIIGVVLVFRDVTDKKKMEAALEQSERTYRNLFHNAQVGLFRTTPDGRVLEANEQFAQLLGYQRREDVLRVRNIAEHYRDANVRVQVIDRLQREGELSKIRTEMVRTDGSPIVAMYSARYDAQQGWLEGVLEDVTDRELALEAIKQGEQRYRYLYEHSPVGLITLDSAGTVKEVNDNTCRLIQQIVGDERLINDLSRLSRFLGRALQENLAAAMASEDGLRGEKRFTDYKGEDVWIRYWVNPIRTDACDGEEILIACEDITSIKEVENRIRYLSFHDKLTGLYNRAYFEEELDRLNTARQMPLSIIIGDVNGLKLVNDAFGHQAGDQFLREIAKILSACCRKEDVIARWGGDEFVILLPKTESRVAEEVCERIKGACRTSDLCPIRPSIALGSATKVDVSEESEGLLRRAEERMYRAKLGESTSARSAIIASLTKTLREKSCETEEHAERLRGYAVRLGRVLGLSGGELDDLAVMAALHDIGKIATPNEILSKPSPLTEEEWSHIREHPEVGYRIAQASTDLAPIAEDILAHHERWDGNGYPQGLRAEEIPIVSRIISVVDAYDVMTNGRPYKQPIDQVEALLELQRCAGTQFDPRIVNAFVAMMLSQDAVDQAAPSQLEEHGDD